MSHFGTEDEKVLYQSALPNLVKAIEAQNKILSKQNELAEKLLSAANMTSKDRPGIEWAKRMAADPADVDDAIERGFDVIAKITEEAESDMDREPSKLLDLYQTADETSKAAIDAALICICGWSMGTIISKCAEEETGFNRETDELIVGTLDEDDIM